MKNSILEIAKQTFAEEQQAIAHVATLLDKEFETAVKKILKTSGRVIISGIGKSAIVAQKIVATFNSTGTPAFFLHAADAIHGDIGMIQKNDIVIILSKSGDSAEIKSLVSSIKNFGNIIIAITGNKQSFLAKQAHVTINSFVAKEACLYNLAPTSSTTVQMILGDALAICLMKMREFSPDDFQKFHPGGNLGKRFYLRIEDIYKHNSSPKVLVNADLKEVILQISKGRVGAAAVVDTKNILLGIITDGDIRRFLEKNNKIDGVKAKNIFTKNPNTTSPEALAIEAFEQLKQNDLNQLIVVDKSNHVLGFVHLHDLIREGIY